MLRLLGVTITFVHETIRILNRSRYIHTHTHVHTYTPEPKN